MPPHTHTKPELLNVTNQAKFSSLLLMALFSAPFTRVNTSSLLIFGISSQSFAADPDYWFQARYDFWPCCRSWCFTCYRALAITGRPTTPHSHTLANKASAVLPRSESSSQVSGPDVALNACRPCTLSHHWPGGIVLEPLFGSRSSCGAAFTSRGSV